MTVDQSHITEYIPQRPPVVMVDEIVAVDEKRVITTFEVTAGNLFVENGQFTESGLLENIAQSAAAQVGYLCKINDEPVPVGFIGAISKVKIYRRPESGAKLRTFIDFEQTVFNVSMISGKVFEGEKLLCECRMKIVITGQSVTI